MTATQLLLVLRGRKWQIVQIVACLAVLTLVVSLIMPKTYVAEASVVISSITTDPVSGSEQPQELLPSNLATQLDVMASRAVALRVIDKLDLTHNAYFKEKYDAAAPNGTIGDWVADRLLLKNLTVIPPKEGNVIGVALAGYSPQFAADLANAFAEAYLETHLELKLQPIKRQAAWFTAQLNDLRKNVDRAQDRLSDYQRSKAVFGTNDKIDVENAKLMEISDQLTAAQSEMYGYQTRLKQMNEALKRGQLEELPEIQGNVLLQTLKANLVAAEAKLAQTSSSFGNNHPDFISAEAQVKELQRKLLAEVDTVKGSIAQSAEISARKEAELRHALEAQRDRVLALKQEQDELDSLKREVADAQMAYDAGNQRSTQVSLESRLDQSNIAILNTAVPPMKKARPKTLLNLALAIFLGLMLGTGWALIREMSDRRIRSPRDVVEATGFEILTEIPPPEPTKRRFLKRKKLIPSLKFAPSDAAI
jgi:chain length determinant protein EpsF